MIFFYLFIYIWLCCTAFYLVVASRGCSPASVCRLLIAVASPVAERGLWGTWASEVVAHGLSSYSSWAPEHRFNSCGAR